LHPIPEEPIPSTFQVAPIRSSTTVVGRVVVPGFGVIAAAAQIALELAILQFVTA
jgi:hypothetical protein